MAKQACADQETRDAQKPATATRQIDSRSIFGDSRIVTIRHGDDVYTLRITRAEKLILTK